MKKVTLVIDDDLMGILGVTANSDDAAIGSAMKRHLTAAKQLKTDLATSEEKVTKLETKVEALENAGNKEKVTAMLSEALDGGKITAELSKQLEKDYAKNPTGLKTILDGMSVYTSVTGQILEQGKKDNSKYAGKSWDELIEGNHLSAFRADNPEAYKKLYKETFGEDPK